MKTINNGSGTENFPRQLDALQKEILKSPSSVCLYRLPQVLALIPVSRSSWFAGIQAGRYPRGHHLGPRTTVWRSDDIDRLIQNLEVVS